jgi:hypothetical protein
MLQDARCPMPIPIDVLEADRREDRIARGESTWVRGEDALARVRAKLK